MSEVTPCGPVAHRYYALLRAINTGSRRVTNEQLLAPFRGLGFDDVAAYQAAGNVTFTTTDAAVADPTRIHAALHRAYGFDTAVFVRSAAEMAAIADTSPTGPFTQADMEASAGKVQVTLLHRAPTAGQLDELAALVPAADRVAVVGREWYWLPVDGISGSTLPVGRVEAVLGEMTMRTLGTVARMVAKFGR